MQFFDKKVLKISRHCPLSSKNLNPRCAIERVVNIYFISYSLIKNELKMPVLVGAPTSPINLFSYTIPLKARRGLQGTICMLAKLCAVSLYDSALCQPFFGFRKMLFSGSTPGCYIKR